jgi:hypothetical protein
MRKLDELETIPHGANVLSGTSRRVLLIVAALGEAALVRLADAVAGLERQSLSVVPGAVLPRCRQSPVS